MAGGEGAQVRVRFEPAGVTVVVARDTILAEAARAAGLAVDQPCGGRGRCGKCLVTVREWGDEPNGRDAADDARVLACQHRLTGDLVVDLGRAALPADMTGLADARSEPFRIQPALSKTFLEPDFLSEPEPADLYAAVLGRVAAAAPAGSFAALRALGAVYTRARSEGLTVLSAVGAACGPEPGDTGRTLLGVEPGDTSRTLLGAAVDIGTTTVVLYLYDLCSGRRLGVASTLNRQAAFGGDVVSRITAASRSGGPGPLQAAALETVAGLLEEACDAAGASPAEVYELVAVGNSTMHHLFLGLDPACIGQAPFRVVERRSLTVPAEALPALGLNPLGRVVFLPLIGGYLGADTVAVILATGTHRAAENRLVIDIGTNGEIVLGGRDGLWACSTAAGPALEGAGLSCGMRARPGAIDEVRIDRQGRIHLSTIGGAPPQGLCGSGVVTGVAEMLRAGLVEVSGRLTVGSVGAVGAADAASERAVVLASAEASGTGSPIRMTQADVRAVQLAKGAIAAGIQTLFDVTGIRPETVSEVILAGAFGNYLDIEDAKAIGLLPDLPGVPVRSVGNAAGAGAQMALLSAESRAEADAVAARVRPVHLSGRPEFQKVFVDCLRFPHPAEARRAG